MPTALILGGLTRPTHAPALSLLPCIFPICEHIRIVDKYLIIPQDGGQGLYTAYVDKLSRKYFEDGRGGKLEYMQGNLLLPETRRKIFQLPSQYAASGKTYDWVFDFTGSEDATGFDLPVHVERIVHLARHLGQAALEAGGPKVYVRPITYYYRWKGASFSIPSPTLLEDSDAECWSDRGKLWHEAARGLAAIPRLNLILVRPAIIYGPYIVGGLTPRLLIGEVYKYLNEKMDFLWEPSLRMHTVHSLDFGGAVLALAQHYSSHPITEEVMNDLKPTNYKIEIDDPGFPNNTQTVRAPIFNVVDEGDTTQEKMSKLVSKLVGVPSGFHGVLISNLAKLNMDEVVEEANDKHQGPWLDMLLASQPPIASTPLSPVLPREMLSHEPIALDGSKLARVTGWKPQYAKVEENVLKETLDRFKEDGVWPNPPSVKRRK
ncbi:hypothetical protein BT69DRAFT_1372399 [Atractiella rhizophila]|nr:hypothetical protein BT69DRAFT_1372399 [Atractiella rhizophila]